MNTIPSPAMLLPDPYSGSIESPAVLKSAFDVGDTPRQVAGSSAAAEALLKGLLGGQHQG
ncbi:MAG: hypothetical protein L0J58_01405 [Micrococcaceae bacterium]|nr:hypothetical protein [Micrococcaceae bacterium]